MMDNLTNMRMMEIHIKERGNLSTPGMDELTYPILKIETRSAARLCVEMMKAMLRKGMCPAIWKFGKTIMLSKGGDVDNPLNWRPITLTSILYRTIFGRIAKEFMRYDEREGRTIFFKGQKGFVPGIGRCSQHTFMANAEINHAITERRQFYISTLYEGLFWFSGTQIIE
jgi:hypothetical protein